MIRRSARPTSFGCKLRQTMQLSAYRAEVMPFAVLFVDRLKEVIELADATSIPQQSSHSGSEATSPPIAPSATADHQLARHWIPWLIPLLAIGLPILGFLVADSVPSARLNWYEVDTSVGRGDFLIPVVILCLEAGRRWWFDTTCGAKLGAVRALGTILCGGAVVIDLYSVAIAASDVVTKDSKRSITEITLWRFTAAILSGTIAVV